MAETNNADVKTLLSLFGSQLNSIEEEVSVTLAENAIRKTEFECLEKTVENLNTGEKVERLVAEGAHLLFETEREILLLLYHPLLLLCQHSYLLVFLREQLSQFKITTRHFPMPEPQNMLLVGEV